MFLTSLFSDIRHKNVEFVGLLTKALQFNDYLLSIIPSIFFLIFTMTVIYRITHKHSPRFRRTSYKDALYREIAFQWLYLYVTRAWLYLLKALKVASAYLEQIVMKNGGEEKEAYCYCVRALMFLIFVVLSITPLVITTTMFTVEESLNQNILFWVPPNRWTRSELGSAGRLMERPPNFKFTNTKFPRAYETKRSVSSENAKTTSSSVEVIRYCKSGCLPDQVSSFQELIRAE